MPYGIEYLRGKLASKKAYVDARYTYYGMKNYVPDLGISTPPTLRGMTSVLGWCGKAVDSLADRLTVVGFDNDANNMGEIYRLNNADVLFDSAITGALISSCDFVYINTDDDGYPRLHVLDGSRATGIMDPATGLLKEGYAVLSTDDKGRPTVEGYFTEDFTEIYYADGQVDVFRNPAPYPLLVPICYRPDAKRQFGRSRISASCMSLVQSAARTVKRSEIAAEFYSFPQKYILGLSEDAEVDKWRASMSAVLTLYKDEDGDKPTVGQFQTMSFSPHFEQLRSIASLFAGETGLTLDDLGFAGDNPSSAEAIKAGHETLRLICRKAQRCFATGFINAGYLAVCVRDNQPYLREAVCKTRIKWAPIFEPDASSLTGLCDGLTKLAQIAPDIVTPDVIAEYTGITGGGND